MTDAELVERIVEVARQAYINASDSRHERIWHALEAMKVAVIDALAEARTAIADELEKPYPTDVFPPLSELDKAFLVSALQRSSVPYASERLHADWARHWAKAIRADGVAMMGGK